MTYYTKMIFGIDPKFHDKIFIGMKFDENENNRSVFIEFDTGEKYIFDKNDDILFLIGEILEIPEQASNITIICENNLKQFGWNVENPAITSIEHFESNCLTDLSHAFFGFINIKEFKHFNVTSKVNRANSMCARWTKFNSSLPDGLNSIFEDLEDSSFMFYKWELFNQKLPIGFCNNTKKMKTSTGMFCDWETYNQPLPEHFFAYFENIVNGKYMFKNWKSYNFPIPKEFITSVQNLENSEYMFFGWESFNQPLSDTFFNNNNNILYYSSIFYNWNSFSYDKPKHLELYF